MPGKFHHEQLYRGADAIERLRAMRITVCGAGALGSNLVDTLARQGAAHLRVIDHDRVEEHNIGTQVYTEADIGVFKAEALRKHVFRAAGVEIEAVRKELTDGNAAALLREADLIVDAFDNAASRGRVQRVVREAQVPALHAGLFADYGEVVWDEHYRVPNDPTAAQDVCEYPLARNLVLLTVSVAAETIARFAATGERAAWSITLRDLSIRPMTP